MNGEAVVVSINLGTHLADRAARLAAAGVRGMTLKSLACSFDSQRQSGDAFRIELPPFGAFRGRGAVIRHYNLMTVENMDPESEIQETETQPREMNDTGEESRAVAQEP